MTETVNIKALLDGDQRVLARAISLVENDAPGSNRILSELPFDRTVPMVGITGPPGAGKSSLVNALISHLIKDNKKAGVIAVDPTSPFNFGSLLGDRIRMSDHFNHPGIFIRSVATRGSLGGLSARIFEISDLMKHAGFDIIFVETVGVGQSEVDIAGLADTTAVVLVPEAGDEVQTLKSGLMEIADLFVVNKSDRDGADIFARNLLSMLHNREHREWQVPVIKTVATSGIGIAAFWDSILQHNKINSGKERQLQLLTEKSVQLVMTHKMAKIDRAGLKIKLSEATGKSGFNLYRFLEQNYYKE